MIQGRRGISEHSRMIEFSLRILRCVLARKSLKRSMRSDAGVSSRPQLPLDAFATAPAKKDVKEDARRLYHRLMHCEFKDVGCDFKGTPQAVEAHNESSAHLHLVLMRVLISKQQAQISSMRATLRNTVMNTTGNLLWKLSDFSLKMKEAETGSGFEIVSLPFSTSPTGYKLQASLFPNGNGTGKDSHISVYIKLLPGEYDSLLRWPFSSTVSFTLLDQSPNPDGKACHIMESFVPDPTWKNFQRPPKERGVLGFGFPEFVSHEMLRKCHYLKDDTVFIRILVDESKTIAV